MKFVKTLLAIFITGIIFAALLVAGLICVCSNTEQSPEQQAERDARQAERERNAYRERAIELAENGILEILKNPAGAQFVHVQAASLVTDVWAIRGEVDATNGFGGVVRTPFQITFKIDRSGASPVWNYTNFIFNGKEYCREN